MLVLSTAFDPFNHDNLLYILVKKKRKNMTEFVVILLN